MCTDRIGIIQRIQQLLDNRNLQGLVVHVLDVHKEKRKTVLLLLLMLIAEFSIQLHNTYASQK